MVKGYTKDIDDEFANVVLSNQVHFGTAWYRFKHFTFQDPEKYRLGNEFSINAHKYVNYVVQNRLEVYKLNMPVIETFEINDVVSTKYFSTLTDVCREFCIKTYSHENIMEVCAAMSTYTRCAFMKGLRSTYWPKYLIAEILLNSRRDGLFSDQTYHSLELWLSNRVLQIEADTSPITFNPVEIKLEWLSPPPVIYSQNEPLNRGSLLNIASSSSRSYADNAVGSINENLEGVPENLETSGVPETSAISGSDKSINKSIEFGEGVSDTLEASGVPETSAISGSDETINESFELDESVTENLEASGGPETPAMSRDLQEISENSKDTKKKIRRPLRI